MTASDPIDAASILLELAQSRPIFHSEADFQHALAWRLHEQMPESRFRLELPIDTEAGRIHVDIDVRDRSGEVLIELKYKTRAVTTVHNGELFTLKNQAAQVLGRYDFLKDVERLESVVSTRANSRAYAILLTNDSAYWKPLRDSSLGYASFSLADGRVLHGELRWGARAGKGTRKNREAPIRISRTYRLRWFDYSDFGGGAYSLFRVLCTEIGPD